MLKNHDKTIVVLGMHRSGTSVVSGVLTSLDVDFGSHLLGANKDNPTGHFEDTRIIKINDEILDAAEGNWAFPPSRFLVLTKGRSKEKLIVDYILNERPNRGMVWGWKDPRMCLTIELYLKHLQNPNLIVVRRSHKDIAKSLSKRDGSDQASNILLAEEYDQRINEFLAKNNLPYLELRYEDLLQDPKSKVKDIAEFLGLGVTSVNKIRKATKLVMGREALQKIKES